MEINVKKSFLLVIDKGQKRMERMPAADLRIKGERLKTLDINNACRYLAWGYWGTVTGKVDMSATSEVVREEAESNQKPPADARTLCRTLRTERIRHRPVLGRPHRTVAEWVGGCADDLGISVYKRMARTMVNCKLSVYILNRRGWPWVPHAVRSTHAGIAAACWPMHAAWRYCKKVWEGI